MPATLTESASSIQEEHQTDASLTDANFAIMFWGQNAGNNTRLVRPQLRRFVVLCILATSVTLLLSLCLIRTTDILGSVYLSSQNDKPVPGFLVHTPGCKIPDFDAFDKSVRYMIIRTFPKACNASDPLTYSDGSWLRINRSATRSLNKDRVDFCTYQVIHRPGEVSDNVYKYDSRTVEFQTDVQMKYEFVRVVCYGVKTGMMYVNFHAFIIDKPEVERRSNANRAKYEQNFRDEETLNVIVLGVDSVSRLNFMRHMPKTRKFLLKDLEAVELKGFNKVADNTYVNIVPMFTGRFVEELPWDETISHVPFDQYDFLWKNFSKRGYRTLFAEDAPQIAIFNYAKEGFHKPPMDYYMRPFSLAMEEHGSVWTDNHDCMGSRLETEVVLDWVHDFMEHFRNKPRFAFAFLTRLTHDSINKAGYADEPYYRFVKKLHDRGHFQNTVLIFFSDHGMRFGSIRETYIGKLEERLPFMYLVFPRWFYRKYPHLNQALRTNVHRLTTPFDIYQTMVDILNFKGDTRPRDPWKRSHSLLSVIPVERTCEQAGIMSHWCACHRQQSVPVDRPQVQSAAHTVVNFINDQLKGYRRCAHLKLQSVISAIKIIANSDVLHFRKSLHDVVGRHVQYGTSSKPVTDYQLTLRTEPGAALFEATVRVTKSEKVEQIVGEISRINRYGDDSTCIHYHHFKKFCYCK